MLVEAIGNRVIRWRLNEVMARYRIKNSELADRLSKHATTISRMRSTDEFPKLGGDALNDLLNALIDLSGDAVSVGDLIEHTKDEE